MTVFYHPDIEFGVEYVACIEGRLRKVFVEAIVLDSRCEDDTPQYIINAAGIGSMRLNVTWQIRSSFSDILCEYDSPFADTKEDWASMEFHKYYMLSTNDSPSYEILHRLLPNFSFYPDIYAWKWNRKELRPYKCDINWSQWRFDANGFFTDIPEKDDEGRIFYYPTEVSCAQAHENELDVLEF